MRYISHLGGFKVETDVIFVLLILGIWGVIGFLTVSGVALKAGKTLREIEKEDAFKSTFKTSDRSQSRSQKEQKSG